MSIHSIERDIKDAWKTYKLRSFQCMRIADRVRARENQFAYPEEIKEFNEKAIELKEIQTYIAERQKYLNYKEPRRLKDNYAFNQQQTELQNELTDDN